MSANILLYEPSVRFPIRWSVIINIIIFSLAFSKGSKKVLQLGYTPNLDQELRERKTLNLYNGACDNWSA